MTISHATQLRLSIARHREALNLLSVSTTPDYEFTAAVDLLTVRILSGNKILICGNGGSAADAQHLAAELVVRYKGDRKPISAIALTTDSSVLTAACNDGYSPFKRQVEALGRPGDVLIAISTSGNSQNIIDSIWTAKNLGLSVIGLTGSAGFRATHQLSNTLGVDVEFRIPSDTTSIVQEMHVLIYHSLVEALERELKLCEFGTDRPRLL